MNISEMIKKTSSNKQQAQIQFQIQLQKQRQLSQNAFLRHLKKSIKK
jgi:hypothetical protein